MPSLRLYTNPSCAIKEIKYCALQSKNAQKHVVLPASDALGRRHAGGTMRCWLATLRMYAEARLSDRHAGWSIGGHAEPKASVDPPLACTRRPKLIVESAIEPDLSIVDGHHHFWETGASPLFDPYDHNLKRSRSGKKDRNSQGPRDVVMSLGNLVSGWSPG